MWAALGSSAATAAARRLTDVDQQRHRRWLRHNHAGRPVSLLEGVWCVCGTAVGLAPVDPVGAGTALGAGLTGAYDDLHPDAARKGLMGHLGALTRGQLSPGALKIVGLLGTGVLGAVVDGRRTLFDVGLDASVVAATANMINLLDLRPGRALKVVLAAGVPLMCGVRGRAAGACVGAAVVLIRADLAGTTMLGDTGANCLGALLGRSAASGSRIRRTALLSALAAGTLVSERVSFSAVIEADPRLRALDQWGRAAS